MTFKQTINGVLAQAGYQVVRTKTLKDLKGRSVSTDKRSARLRRQIDELAGRLGEQSLVLGSQAERLEGQTAALEEQVKKIASLTKPKPKPPAALPADYTEESKAIWPKVKDRTMNTHEKVNFVHDAVRYINRYQIPGAIVECGVWRGGTMMAMAHTLDLLGVDDRDLYLFDTFSGMTEPTERDVHVWAKQSATEILSAGGKTAAKMWIPASLEDVREGFNDVNYPSERIHFVEGKVEETIPQHAPEQISILRLDTDWYDSTKHELDHLYHRLAPGGVLIIDDYGSWQGSRDATDEFLERTGEPLLLTRISRTRVAVKPGLQTS